MPTSPLQDHATQATHRGCSRHVPMRTCAGCRVVAEQASLLRAVVDSSGQLRVDRGPRQPGRGVYVHPQTRCLTAAVRGGFQRALRRNLQVRADLVQEAMTAPAAHGMQHELKRDNS